MKLIRNLKRKFELYKLEQERQREEYWKLVEQNYKNEVRNKHGY